MALSTPSARAAAPRPSPCPGLALLAGLILLGAALTSCAHTPPQAPYPHESIMTIIAELKIHLERDPYRRPPGVDMEGRNIYRVSLARLDQLKQLTSEEYRDVLAFARAQCDERLGDWSTAAADFDLAATGKDPLASIARQRAHSAAQLADLTNRQAMSQTLDGYLNDLDVLERQLEKLKDSKPDWPYDSYVTIELERTREEQARLLFENRLVRPGALPQALEKATQLVDQHTDSWRISEHRLLLGSFFETLARDWATDHPPQGNTFASGEEQWKGWVEKARQSYRIVAQTDGDPVKPEGQARLRALDAWSLRVEALSR